jgi:hypothetical protein
MDPNVLSGYDVIMRDDRGWNGQRERMEASARKSLEEMKSLPRARAWWLIEVRTNKVLVEGGEGVGHHPSEYGYDPEQGLASLFYKKQPR